MSLKIYYHKIKSQQMKYQNIVLTLIICSFLFSLSNTQIVDCIGYIKSIFATTGWCTSTSTDLRPINATGYMKYELVWCR